MILATGAMAAIRYFHPYAELSLLTTAPYAALAEQMGWFDEVLVDARAKFWQVANLSKTLRYLRGGSSKCPFQRIYDLQGSDRTGWYFHLMGWPKPQWVGKVRGCSHPRNLPDNQFHILDIYKQHLTKVGVPDIPDPNVDWLMGDVTRFNLPERFVLLVPSCSPKRPRKRWTAAGYAALIDHLDQQKIISVMVGAEADRDFTDVITQHCESRSVINLVGKTRFGDLASIARQAEYAIGSDTGPMHIVAATGCRVLVLFSSDSNPKLCGPRGDNVMVLQCDDLQNLSAEEVMKTLAPVLSDS